MRTFAPAEREYGHHGPPRSRAGTLDRSIFTDPEEAREYLVSDVQKNQGIPVPIGG